MTGAVLLQNPPGGVGEKQTSLSICIGWPSLTFGTALVSGNQGIFGGEDEAQEQSDNKTKPRLGHGAGEAAEDT